MTERPTLIFVLGAWHSPDCFDKVVNPLRTQGYTCLVPDLPSTADCLNKTTADNTAAIRALVVEAIDGGAQVLVVAHSSGGFTACDAVEGLSQSQRKADGEPGGVVGIAMIAAFIPPVFGKGAFKDCPKPDHSWWVIDTEANTFRPNDPTRLFYNDLLDDEARYWTDKIRPMHFGRHTGFEGWRQVPIFYLICEKDVAQPVQLQEAMIDAVRREGGTVTTERVPSGHSPFLSMPQTVVEWICRCAGGV